MAEITVDVGVRLNVLQSSIADLERIVSKSLTPDTSGFKAMQKIITSMRNEAEKLQIQMNKGFGSQQQFNQAGKTIENLETSLARAKLAAENIKFSDIKLDSNQQKMFSDIEQQIAKAEAEFTEFQNRVKDGILQNTSKNVTDLVGLQPSDFSKSFDEVSAIIDRGVSRIEKQYAEANQKLASARLRATPDQRLANEVANQGISKDTFSSYDNWFRDNGQLMNESSRENMLKAFIGQFDINDATKTQIVDSLKNQTVEMINEAFKNMKDLTGDELKNSPLRVLAEQAQQYAKNVNPHVNNVQELESQLQLVRQLQAEMQAATSENGAMAPGIEKYNQQINAYADALQRLREQIVGATRNQLGFGGTFGTMEGELRSFTQQLNAANAQFLRLQSQRQTFNSMKMAITNFMGFNQVLNLTKRAVNDAMNHIKQLDTTMAGISIVTDMSTADLWKQVDAYSALAQKFGTTIQGAYDISKIYYQQGLETKDVMTLTEETLKLSKVSGLDYAKSTDYMTTALRGFKMEMQEAGTVVDVYSNLAANTAVSQEELAVAMSKTASSMESVGSTFEDTSAMIATMVAVTRESATNIGSAMKSIASRYGELTKDPTKLIDSEGEAMSFNKVDEALRSVGISMQTTDHQFRDFTDVIVELSEKWDTLDSTQQRYIATQFAGNRQQSRFLALVSNGDLLKENMEVAENSEDVGTLQALKAMDSIESKMNQVQVAAQQFYTTIGAEGVWKGALDGIKNYINGLNNLPKAFNTVPIGALAMVANLISGIKTLLFQGVAAAAKAWKMLMDPQANGAIAEAETSAQQAGQSVGSKFVDGLYAAGQGIKLTGRTILPEGLRNGISTLTGKIKNFFAGDQNVPQAAQQENVATENLVNNATSAAQQAESAKTQIAQQGAQERIAIAQEEMSAIQRLQNATNEYKEVQAMGRGQRDLTFKNQAEYENAAQAAATNVQTAFNDAIAQINNALSGQGGAIDIAKIEEQFAQLKNIEIPANINTEQAKASIDELEAKIQEIKAGELKLNTDTINNAKKEIQEAQEELNKLKEKNPIEIDSSQLDALEKKIKDAKAALESMSGKQYTDNNGAVHTYNNNDVKDIATALNTTNQLRGAQQQALVANEIKQANTQADQLTAKLQNLSNIPTTSIVALKDGLTEARQEVAQLEAIYQHVANQPGEHPGLEDLKKKLDEAKTKATELETALKRTMMSTASKFGGLATALNMVSGLFNQTSRSGQVMAGTLQIVAGAAMSVKAVLDSLTTGNPFLATASAILFISNGISKIYENDEERAERLSKAAEEANNKAKEKNADYKLLDRSINKLHELEKARYDSAEAAEEYQTAVDDLASKYPQLITSLDEAGNAAIEAASLDYELEKARRASAQATMDAVQAEIDAKKNEIKQAKKTNKEQRSNIFNLQSTTRGGTIEGLFSDNDIEEIFGSPMKAKGITTENMTGFITSKLHDISSGNIEETFDSSTGIDYLKYIKEGFTSYLGNDNIWHFKINEGDIEKFNDFLKSNNLNQYKEQILALADIDEGVKNSIESRYNTLKSIDLNNLTEDQEKQFNNNVDDLIKTISSDTAAMVQYQPLLDVLTTYQKGSLTLAELNQQMTGLDKQLISSKVMNRFPEFYSNLGEFQNVVVNYLNGFEDEANFNVELENIKKQFELLSPSNRNKLLDMWANKDQYTAKDFTGIVGDNTPLFESISNYYKQVLPHYTEYLQDKITAQFGETSQVDGVDGLSKAIGDAENIISANLQGWLSDVIDLISEYSEQGMTQNATDVAKNATKVLEALNNITDPFTRAIVTNSMKENGISNISSIDSIISDIADTPELESVKVSLENLKNSLIYNLPLAIDAYSDKLITDIEDVEKSIKDISNGMSISEALAALDKINLARGENEPKANLSDMKTKNGKVFFDDKNNLRQEYINTIIGDLYEERDAIQDEIDALGNDEDGKRSVDALTTLIDQFNSENLPELISIEKYQDIAKVLMDLGYASGEINEKTGEVDQFKLEVDKFKELAISDNPIDVIIGLLTDRMANANSTIEFTEKELRATEATNAGKYTNALALRGAKGSYKNTSEILNTLAISKNGEEFGLNYEDIKADQEAMNSAYNTFFSDLFKKGVENLHFEDYQLDINESEWTNMLSMSYDQIVATYGQRASMLIEEQNALMVQALEKETQSTIGAEDALKNVNFIKEDLAYASMDTLQSLADSLHVAVETLFNPTDYDAALGGYKVDMAALAANGLSEIVNSSNIVADSVKAFLDSISEGIGKGLEGKLGFAERDNLISNLGKYGMELDAADFTRTADGLKLSEQKAIELYNTLKQIDGISAQITFDALAKSLEDNNENYTNISTIAKRIADLQREIDNPNVSSARRQEYEAELAVAEEIYRVRSSTDNKSFDFMNRDLPNGMQNPIDYWNSTGEAYKVMNQAAKSGYMEIQDFYNIVNEMNNMAAVSGQTLSFMGQTLSGKAEDAAALIEAGMSALKNVDGEGVKIALGSLGVDFATGAADMTGDFDTGIKAMAKSQIKMLDAAINMLEAIVALQDIDAGENGVLDVGEVFTFDKNGKLLGFTTDIENWLNKVEALCGPIEIGGISLRDALFQMAESGTEGQEKAVQFLNDLRNLDFETGNIADVSAKINNLISTFWPGKTITTGPSIFEILDIPKNLSEKSEAFKKWADDLDIGVDTASRMIDLMKKGGNVGTIDSTYGKAIQKLLGIDEKTKEQFTAFLDDGKHITTADIQRWSNISFEENVEGVVEGTYNGSDGGSITLSGDDGNAWRTQIENYEFALQQARMSGGGQVTTTNNDNSEFTFTTQMGARQVVAVTNGETTTYKFPDFEIQAATMGEALKAYAQHKKDSGNAHYSNMTAGEILSELGYVLKESTKVTLQPGEDGDAKAQIEEILSHSKEEIENALNDPKNKTINDDGTVDWTIELGGQEFQITSNGEEINASTFVDNLSTQMGLDTKLIDNIVKAIQQAFEGDAGAKIGQAIREGIETAFSSAEKQVGGEGAEQQAIPVGEITLKPTSVTLDISETPPQLKETLGLGESIPLGDIEGTATSVSLSSIGGVTKTDATIIANKNVGDIGDVEGTATAGEVTSIGSGWKLSKTGEGGTIKLAESLGNVGADASSATVTVLDNNFLPETNEITTLEFTSATGTVTTVTVKPINGYETNNEAESLKYTGTQEAKIDQVNVKPTSYTITWTDAAGNTKTVEVSANVLLQANNYTEFVAQIQNLVKDETKTIKLEFEGEPPTIDDILNDPKLNWRPSYQGNYNTPMQPAVTPEVKAEKVEASGASIKADGATVNLSNKQKDTGNETGNQTGMDVSSVTASGAVNVSGSPVNVAGSTGGNEGGGGTEAPTLDISGITSALDGLRSALSKPTSAISLLAGAIGSIPTDKAQAVRNTANAINQLKDKNITVKATVQGTIRASMSATVSVDGAASASANAQIAEKKIVTHSGAKGNVALAKGTNLSLATGKKQTLMGELGPELVVSNGRYYTVGNNGAEFVDLPEDAIVFNHKQTRKLLGNKGSINGRGKPVKSENTAISFATGNVSGPAMAGAAAALNVLKQIRSMWQSMLDASAKDLGSQGGAGRGGRGGGGGGGGDKNNARYIHDLEIWYNLLRQIAKLEKDISLEEAKQNKLQNDRIANGDKIYQSYKAELKYLDQSIAKNSQLVTLRKKYYDDATNKLKDSKNPFSKLFNFTPDGVLQYNTNLEDYINKLTGNSSFKNGKLHLQGTSIVRDAEGKAIKFKKGKKKGQAKTTKFDKKIDIANSALDFLSLLNATNPTTGAAAYTPEEQVAILKAYGFGSVIQYDEKGQKITGDDAAIKMVENFWNQLDNIMKNTDDLFDDYLDGLQKIEELEAQQNEILDKIRDNQIDLENKVLDAVEARAQEQIDALQDQRDSLEKSNQKFLDGLKDSLDKERQMYQQNQDSQELNKMQRQLAILQRSGGSATQIKSLQDQISQKQQDAYFTERENQINTIQEASDKQLERLDTQISIMTDTLDYQKENGLLWIQVKEIMQGSADSIAAFIEKYDKDYQAMGATEQAATHVEDVQSAQMFDKDRGYANRKQTAWEQYLSGHTDLQDTTNAEKRSQVKAAFDSAYDNSKENIQTATTAANQKIKNWDAKPATSPQPKTQPPQKKIESKVITTAPLKKNVYHYNSQGKNKKRLKNKDGQWVQILANNVGPKKDMEKIYYNGQDYYVKLKDFKKGAKWKKTTVNENELTSKAKTLGLAGAIKFKYKQGGMADFTGPAWLDGTTKKPEAVLNAAQTEFLKNDLLGNKNTSLMSIVAQLQDTFGDTATGIATSSIDESVTIENVAINFNAGTISSDYDARRAGELVKEEMLKIARKTTNRSVSRR